MATRQSRDGRPAAGARCVFTPSNRFVILWPVLAGCLGLAWAGPVGRAAEFEARLSWTNAPDGLDVTWTSESLTPASPFVHYDFQVEQSPNLDAWEDAVLIPGGFLGSASISHRLRLPATNAQAFVRLRYRLNMPGADLSGLDLSGADLRGANLAGADLSGTILDGALLAGADLTGANLTGATFDGANLQDLNLDGIDLANLDLSTIAGTPVLTQLTANPAGKAADLVPHLPYNADGTDLVADDPNLAGVVSTRHAMLMLKTNATVGQLNALLGAHGASIVASSPADATLPNATLMARFPSASAQDLYDLTVALNEDPIVEAAAPDVLMGLAVIPDDTGAAPDWKWDTHGQFTGGNWGLEMGHVPQMWNVYNALQNKGVGRVPTCIIDASFLSHVDLNLTFQIGSSPLAITDHGNHVAGIVGATYGNRIGIDGVNPLASLIGYTFRTVGSDYPLPNLPAGTFEPGRQANAYSMIQDVRDALRLVPSIRVINMSLGYNWYLATNAARPTRSSPFTASQRAFIEFVALKYGTLMRGVAAESSSTLIVCAAGNDSSLIPARVASPMCTAALTLGAPNILVVGSHDINGAVSSFSNEGAHVLAPGEGILSTAGTSSTNYLKLQGTSMASPFVAGVAGYLLAVDPSLTPATLKSLIGVNGFNVNAFDSLMAIDQVTGRKDVLRMLLDIDDSSADGCLRVRVPAASLTHDRSFEEITGADFNDLAGVVGGDEVIDMADFRRWRDWLLFGIGNHRLNGSADHLSLDANADGTAHPFDDSQKHPRGDFNGDGLLDLDTANLLPGLLPRTDLQVLIFGGLWEDPCYSNAMVLSDLVDSVDLHVSATNFFYKNTDISQEVKVAVYDADKNAPLNNGGICVFSPGEPEHIFTVPTGAKYFVASDPIPLGGDTNVQMRTENKVAFEDGQRGADFVVDLTLREMTAVADTGNPVLRNIDSQPDTNRVEAYLGTAPGATNPPSSGVRARANEDATLYSIANADSLPQPPDDPATNTTFAGAVRWQRSFAKDDDLRDPRFFLESLVLDLFGFGATTNEQSAFAEFFLEIRAYDRSPAWEPVFFHRAEIAGRAAAAGQPHTFRIVGEEGDFPPQQLEMNGTFGARYEQKGRRTRIDLEGIPDGHSFELRVRLNTRVEAGPAGDNGALARLGDPLEYKSGFRMNYGRFGDLPLKKGISRSAPVAALNSVRLSPGAEVRLWQETQRGSDAPGSAGLAAPEDARTPADTGAASTFQAAGQPPVVLTYLSKTNFYYRLYQGTDADTDGLPLAMKLGIDGDDTMTDLNPVLPDPTEDDYTLENQPIDQPLDFDADGIDDVYELRRPSILDPLNSADAFLDPDGDGRSNLEEYLDGTDPETPDSPPTNPVLNFPGLLVPSYPGGELIDLNNDGLLDSASGGLNVALAHLGGTFDTPITSPLPGIRVVYDTAYVKLDGDAYPDAVVIDFLTNRVFTFRGAGDGTFTPLTDYAGLNNPAQIALCKVNGDALTDLAVFSENARGVDLHLNNGDGTLTRAATMATNAYGSGNCFAMADLNNDSRDDVIVGYAANAVVFLSQPDGTYGAAQPFPVGSFPEAIAAGDLNHDGPVDLVVANSSSDDISVLIASAPGVFLPQVRYPVGDNPRGLRLRDLNGDTHLDAVVSLVSKDYQVILPGVGNGALAPPYTVPTGDHLINILDWNHDGWLDLISGTGVGSLVNFGNGDGTFDTRLQIVPTNTPPTDVTAVDVNGDGKLELVGLQTQRHSIDVWEHAAVTGTNRLLTAFVVGHWVEAFTHGDFNGDGRVDLAVATRTNSFNPRGSNQIVILTNTGNFTFQDAGHYPLAAQPLLVVSGDFNGDGALDLAVQTSGGAIGASSQLLSLLGNGAGGFAVGTSVVLGATVSFIASANAEGDFRSEVVVRGGRIVGTQLASFLEVLAADGSGGWTNRQSLAFTNTIFAHQVLSLNGDAYPDLAVTQFDQVSGHSSLRMYPGSPVGFGAEQVLANEIEFTAFSRLADLNGDGLIDATAGSSLHLGKPGGGFHPEQDVYIGAEGIRAVADFNLDGKADLLNGLSILLQE